MGCFHSHSGPPQARGPSATAKQPANTQGLVGGEVDMAMVGTDVLEVMVTGVEDVLVVAAWIPVAVTLDGCRCLRDIGQLSTFLGRL